MNHFSLSFCFSIRLILPDRKHIKSRFNKILGVYVNLFCIPRPDV